MTFKGFCSSEFEGIFKQEPFFRNRSKQIEATLHLKAKNFGQLSKLIDEEIQRLSNLRYDKEEMFFYILIKIRLFIELEDYRNAHIYIVEQVPFALEMQLNQRYIELLILEMLVLTKIGSLDNAVRICQDLRILILRANSNLKAEYYFNTGVLGLAYVSSLTVNKVKEQEARVPPKTSRTEGGVDQGSGLTGDQYRLTSLARDAYGHLESVLNMILINSVSALKESVKIADFQLIKNLLFLMANVYEIQENQADREKVKGKFSKLSKIQAFVSKSWPKLEENRSCLQRSVALQAYIVRLLTKVLLE